MLEIAYFLAAGKVSLFYDLAISPAFQAGFCGKFCDLYASIYSIHTATGGSVFLDDYIPKKCSVFTFTYIRVRTIPSKAPKTQYPIILAYPNANT